MTDPLGFVAHRPSEEQIAPSATRNYAVPTASGRAYDHTCDSPEAMKRCLTCPVPKNKCKGGCTGKARLYQRKEGSNPPGRPKKYPVTADPCATCHEISKAVCKSRGSTCAEKVRWEATGPEGEVG